MERRTKSGLAVTPRHLALCDSNLKLSGARSRNEYVEMAIEFYSGYLNAEKNPRLFENLFTGSAEKKMDTLIKTMGTGQYKIAVELSKLSSLVARCINISENELGILHQKCAEEVKNLNSVPTFRQAYRDDLE